MFCNKVSPNLWTRLIYFMIMSNKKGVKKKNLCICLVHTTHSQKGNLKGKLFEGGLMLLLNVLNTKH